MQRSADAGCAEGFCSLATAYQLGKGVAKDDARAYELMRRAADMSHPEALNFLGYCLQHGVGVEPNAELSVRYYEKAASLGNSAAFVNLADCYETGVASLRTSGEQLLFIAKRLFWATTPLNSALIRCPKRKRCRGASGFPTR